MVDADCQLERLIAGAADPRHIDVDDMGSIILGGVAVADAAQHAFDDVNVMLSAIQAAHTVCWCTCNADRVGSGASASAFAHALRRDKGEGR